MVSKPKEFRRITASGFTETWSALFLIPPRAIGMKGNLATVLCAFVMLLTSSVAAYTQTSDAPLALAVDADRLEILQEREEMVAIGNVVVQYGEDTLRADYMKIERDTGFVRARGNVVLLQSGWEWTGDRLDYDFRERRGDFGRFEGRSGVYYIRARESESLPTGEFRMRGVMATTCNPDEDRMEFRVRATSAKMDPGNRIWARNVVPFLGPVPFFYLPIAWLSLDGTGNWDISAGRTGRWGYFLLVGYRNIVNENFRHVTHFDLRSKRGLGLGQDLIWQRSDESGGGQLELYHIYDQQPFHDDFERERFGDEVDRNRYRVRLRHDEAVTARDYFTMDLQYVSDVKLREDFFERDFRMQSQPENRISLSHRGDNFSASILLNARLNDFYENVNRLPELGLDFSSQEIADSGIYYQGRNRLSYLERVFPDRADRDDYDSARLDSYHLLLYPQKYFGYLNVIPRVGFRGTYYSDLAPKTETITTTVLVEDEDGNLVEEEETETLFFDRSGDEVRTLYEFGLESSFKAFKIISEHDNMFGSGLRHVVEPYTNYSFRSEPSLERDELLQFDAIDRIGKRNDITLGTINKLQTRRGGSIVSLVDLDIYNLFRLDPEEDETHVGPLRIDGDLRPVDRFDLRFNSAYDWDTSTLTDFNARLSLGSVGRSRLHLDYGYRDSDKHLVALDIDYFPVNDWGIGLYSRYDIEDGELEESRISLLHEMDCVGWQIGFRTLAGRGGEPDSQDIWATVWLLAFPQMELKFLDASY